MHSERSYRNDHACLVQYAIFKEQLHQGRDYIFTGTPIYKNGRITMEHPEIFTQEDYEAKQETLQPVYPLTNWTYQ